MGDVGRPTELNDELCLKIRQLILEEKSLSQIAKICGISFDTMQGWITRNYNGFTDKWKLYHAERKLQKAERNIEEFLEMNTENKACTKKGDIFTFDDPKLKKIKADVSLFVAETVGKVIYSKRTELTGKDGEPLTGNKITFVDFNQKKDGTQSAS